MLPIDRSKDTYEVPDVGDSVSGRYRLAEVVVFDPADMGFHR